MQYATQASAYIAPMATPNIHTDFSGKMSYGDYLHLDTLLTAQHTLSDAPTSCVPRSSAWRASREFSNN